MKAKSWSHPVANHPINPMERQQKASPLRISAHFHIQNCFGDTRMSCLEAPTGLSAWLRTNSVIGLADRADPARH